MISTYKRSTFTHIEIEFTSWKMATKFKAMLEVSEIDYKHYKYTPEQDFGLFRVSFFYELGKGSKLKKILKRLEIKNKTLP